MLSLINRLKVTIMLFKLVRNPNRTDLIFKGVDIVSKDSDQRIVKELEQSLLSNESFRGMHEEGYIPSAPKLTELAKLHDDSFGKALHLHMHKNNLDFTLFPRIIPKRPIEYLSARIYQDHDLWHVLLGCGTGVEDELAIQAFGVAQIRTPVGVMIIAGGLLHLLAKNPMKAVAAIEKISNAYLVGKKSKFLLSVKLHDLLEKSLDEVRSICSLEPLSI